MQVGKEYGLGAFAAGGGVKAVEDFVGRLAEVREVPLKQTPRWCHCASV